MIASRTSQNERKTTGGDHPQNNLAKFGYILDMKVETKNLLYSWLHTGTYQKNLAIRKFLVKIWQIQAIFSWKFLYEGKKCGKTLLVKETLMITSVFFGGKFSYFFNLKKMISNFDTYKGFFFFSKIKKKNRQISTTCSRK